MNISWTVIELGNSLAPVWSVAANGLSSILTIFLQFLPYIIIFSTVLYLIPFFYSLFSFWSFYNKKQKNNTVLDNSTFSSRQKNK